MSSKKTSQYDHSLNQTSTNSSRQIKNTHLTSNNDVLNHLNSNKVGKVNDNLHTNSITLSNNQSVRRNEFGFPYLYNYSHKSTREVKADSLNHKSTGKYNNASSVNVGSNNVDLQNLFSPAQSHRTLINGNVIKNNVNNNVSNENMSFRTPIPKNPKWKTSISNFINASTNNNTNSINNNTSEVKLSQAQGLSNTKRAYLLAKFKKQIFFFAVKTSDPKITRLHKKIISLGATVETFFSAKVTHKIVEDSRELTQRLINEERKEYLYSKPKENNDLKKSQNIVNCKEWTVAYLIRCINQIITDPGSTQQRLSLTQRLQQEKIVGSGLNTNREIHLLRQYYLVVEDLLSLHRPIAVREYPIPKSEEKNLPSLWPQLYLIENPNGRSPFNPPQPRDYLRHQQKNLKNETNTIVKKTNNPGNINKINENNNTAVIAPENANNHVANNNVQELKQPSELIDKQQDSHSHIRHIHVGNSIASGIVSFSIKSRRDTGEIVVPISQYAKEKDWKRKEISIADNKKKVEIKKVKTPPQKQGSKSGDKSAIRPPAFMNKPGYCENCSVKFMNFGEHIKSIAHRSFAENKNNFISLDHLINEIRECQKEDEESDFDSSSFDSSSDYDYVPSNKEDKLQEDETTTTTDLDISTLNTEEDEEDISDSETKVDSESEEENEEIELENETNEATSSNSVISYTLDDDDEEEEEEEENNNNINNNNKNLNEEIENEDINDDRDFVHIDQGEIEPNVDEIINIKDKNVNEEVLLEQKDNKTDYNEIQKAESVSNEINADINNKEMKEKSQSSVPNEESNNTDSNEMISINIFNGNQSSPSKCTTNQVTLELIKDILTNNYTKDIEATPSLEKLSLEKLCSKKVEKQDNIDNENKNINKTEDKNEVENKIENKTNDKNKNESEIENKTNDKNKNESEIENKTNDKNKNESEIETIEKDNVEINTSKDENENSNKFITNRIEINDNIVRQNISNNNNGNQENEQRNEQQTLILDNQNKEENNFNNKNQSQTITSSQKLVEMEAAFKKQYGLNLDSKNLNFGSYYSEDTTELSELNQKSMNNYTLDVSTTDITSEDVPLKSANKKIIKDKSIFSSEVNINELDDAKKDLLLDKQKLNTTSDNQKKLDIKENENSNSNIINNNNDNNDNDNNNNGNSNSNNEMDKTKKEEMGTLKIEEVKIVKIDSKNNEERKENSIVEKKDDPNKDKEEVVKATDESNISKENSQNQMLPTTPKLKRTKKPDNEGNELEIHLSNNSDVQINKQQNDKLVDNTNSGTPKIEKIQTKEIENNDKVIQKGQVNTPIKKTRRNAKKNIDKEKPEVKNSRRGRPRKNANENKEKDVKEKEVKNKEKKERTTRKTKIDNNQNHEVNINESETNNDVKEEGLNKRKRANTTEPVVKRTKRSQKNKNENNEVINETHENENTKMNQIDDKHIDQNTNIVDDNKENILEPNEEATPNIKRKRVLSISKIEKENDFQKNDNTTMVVTGKSRKRKTDDKYNDEISNSEILNNNEKAEPNPIETNPTTNENLPVIPSFNKTPERKRGLSNKLSLSLNKRLKKKDINENNGTKKNSNSHSLSNIFKKYEDNIPSNDDIDKKLNFILSTLEGSDLDKNLSSFTSDVASPPPHQILKSDKRKAKSQLNPNPTTISNSSSDEDLKLVITPPPTNVTFTRRGTPRTPRIKQEISNPSNITMNNIPLSETKSTVHTVFNPQPTPVTSNLSTNKITNVQIKKEKENENLNTPSHQRTINSTFSDIEIIENEKKLDSILSTLQSDNLLSLIFKKNDITKKTKTEVPLKSIKRELDQKEKIPSLVENPTPIYFSYLSQSNDNEESKL
ncbi:hypothetical protein BCR36DRAFT_415386 [Piromyces finnis]|uniref:DBF4-type domain-containing protein n=1 Tax=Piromyces finnis TaxID=1754191 RepID=A0A1Y1V054_9FUNG|nr:hypothetical protein BCR36DRAFT_415386 [Piromyces finnis]|eukprot:ORX43787.1 hypothetical protein BCR36DRAFT_415386 [Piromyces finnis]